MEFVGRTMKKEFKGFGVYSGLVKSYEPSTGLFQIAYEDGDSEELELSEIGPLLEGMVVDQSGTDGLTKKPGRVGRKPKKRRRVELRSDSGNNSALLIDNSCLNESLEETQRADAASHKGLSPTLEKEIGIGEVMKETVTVNGSLDDRSTHDLLVASSDDRWNLNELNSSDELHKIDGFVLNGDHKENSKRITSIDLNLDANGDYDDNLECGDSGVGMMETQKKEHCFDLNLGLDDEIKDIEVDYNEQMECNTSFYTPEEPQKKEIGGAVEDAKMENGCANETLKTVPFEVSGGTPMKSVTENVLGDSYAVSVDGISLGAKDAKYLEDCMSSEVHMKGEIPDTGAPLDHGHHSSCGSTYKGRNKTKRRKLSESVNSVTETVLRRSTRRGRATLSSQHHVPNGTLSHSNDASSPAVSAVSEEKPTVSGYEDSEEWAVLPPKLQLPPSSESLNLDGFPIFDLFSVYTFLRSFSTLLFLSPFELEDFVAALKCKAPTLLFDFIHVSLLQTLRKHLESLSDESSQSASNCLRSLNWGLLDTVTWPIFMVEYLLMHGSGLKPGFDLRQLKLFEIDYYKQPVSVKIEILRCLCDDVIEVEAIRSELNRRTMTAEPSMDSDRNVKIETSKRKRAQMDVSGASCLDEEEVNETTDDWNSDECCLCKMDGSLICCDGCPAAFHSKCVGVASSLLPEGDWYCPECVIDKDKPWMKMGKSLRGAELLGIDPHGRLYYSSCGYLLVADSWDTESSFNYYHRNDLAVVTETLKSSDIHYSGILSAISKEWDMSTNFTGAKDDLDSHNLNAHSDVPDGQVFTTPAQQQLVIHSETYLKDEIMHEQKTEQNFMATQCSGNMDELVTVNHFSKMENLMTDSEGSAEISQATTDIKNSEMAVLDRLKRSVRNSCDSKIPTGSLSVEDCSLMSANLDIEQENNTQSGDCVHTILNNSQGQCASVYMNSYSFAETASLVAQELTLKSSDKVVKYSTWSEEEIISGQLKAISKKSSRFHWVNIQKPNVDARGERCGWCFSCKVPDDDRDCLFNVSDTAPTLEGLTGEVVSPCSKKNKKGHLIDVMCHIICIEDRLHGLLRGPWLNPHYSKFWRKNIFKAFDVTLVKQLLLTLESNLHQLALSPEWRKHVDSVHTMGSASHVAISSSRISSKHGIGRKRARCSDMEPNSASNGATGLVLFWWRGGRLSRRLFNCKVLPRSLATKAARQAGFMKIPGILYPDSSELAKRSKDIVWRAAVETSRSVEQLALQVRELDANIKWDEIENTNLLSMVDKEYKKSVRSFKKVIIRRKVLEGSTNKYLFDFGKRRFIPDVVVKHGSMVEESSSERKKYWLEESYVPLHLLKVFEEKTIARKSSKLSPGKLHECSKIMKTNSKKKGFSYLFSKAERSEYYQCGHCNKDVLIREAVGCLYCKGFFHKRHVKKSGGAITAECTYTCHKCQNGKCLKTGARKEKSKFQKNKKASTVCRTLRSNVNKNSSKNRRLAKHIKDSVAVPLRRSTRKVQCVSLQNKNLGGKMKGKQTKPQRRKKGKQKKSRKGTPLKAKKGTLHKKRAQVNHAYWLNGLQLSKKPNDERGAHFRSTKLLATSEKLSAFLDQPKCSLCCEPEFTSTLNYIGCEICGDWFHGDAFGLCTGNIGNLVGFKCHKCRDRTPPVCPHLHGFRNDEVQLADLVNNAGIKFAVGASDMTPTNEVFAERKSHSHESKNLFSINDSCHEEQQSEDVSSLNQLLMLDTETGKSPISEEQKADTLQNSGCKDWRQDVFLRSRENILLVENASEVAGGHVSVDTLVETDPAFCKSDVDVIDSKLESLGHNSAKNGLVKTTAIIGSLVNKSITDPCELPSQAILAPGKLPDEEKKML